MRANVRWRLNIPPTTELVSCYWNLSQMAAKQHQYLVTCLDFDRVWQYWWVEKLYVVVLVMKDDI